MVNLDHMIVFVSYSNRNRQRIEDLVLQLGQLGHDVQFESKVIGGAIAWQQVLDTIATSDLFVATLSAETLVSYSSAIETEYARDLNKYILFVALDEISTLTSLDPQISANAVDFSNGNPSANDALAAAINSIASLEPRPLTVMPPPNWNTALNELRDRINAETDDAGEQGAILLNLREFLERHETFEPAKALLAAFSSRSDLRPDIKIGARRLTRQAKHVGSLIQKIQRRGIFYGAIILSLMVSLAVVLLSQVVLQFRAQRGATARLTSTAQTPRAVTATFTPVQTRIIASATFTQLAAVVSPTRMTTSPEVTATDTPIVTNDSVSTSMAAFPNGTSTAIPSSSVPAATFTQTAIPILLTTNTSRPVDPTSVAQVITSVTKLPATSTPFPPTLTPTLTLTVTPKPTLIATTTAATQIAASVSLTPVPAQSLTLAPTNGSAVNLEPLMARNIYVGLGLEDSVFGVRVNVVGTTAQSAGVQLGDYILAVGTTSVRTRFEFLKVVQAQNPSSNIALRIRRDNRIINIPLVLDERDFALPYPN